MKNYISIIFWKIVTLLTKFEFFSLKNSISAIKTVILSLCHFLTWIYFLRAHIYFVGLVSFWWRRHLLRRHDGWFISLAQNPESYKIIRCNTRYLLLSRNKHPRPRPLPGIPIIIIIICSLIDLSPETSQIHRQTQRKKEKWYNLRRKWTKNGAKNTR